MLNPIFNNDRNEFHNIKVNAFARYKDKNHQICYKLWFNLTQFKKLNNLTFSDVLTYGLTNLSNYKSEFNYILRNKYSTGYSLLTFCSFYNYDTSEIINILDKDYITVNEYRELIYFSNSDIAQQYMVFKNIFNAKLLGYYTQNAVVRCTTQTFFEEEFTYNNKKILFTNNPDKQTKTEVKKDKFKVVNI
jgi:hypothetical protein